jgi:hypothetical protein
MRLVLGQIYDAYWGGRVRQIKIIGIRKECGHTHTLIDVRASKFSRLGPKILQWLTSYPSYSNFEVHVADAIRKAKIGVAHMDFVDVNLP